MALHFTPISADSDGKQLTFWGVHTIYYAMSVKAQTAGKSPKSQEAYDLMGEIARNEALRIYNETKQHPDLVVRYFRIVLAWCQEHVKES